MRFEELVKKISPTLKRITYKLSSKSCFASNEDLFQEALLHLWQKYCRGELKDKTDSYILQGCYFHLKNHLRKTREKRVLVSLEARDAFDEGPSLEESACLIDQDSSCYLDKLHNKMLLEAIRNNGLTTREKHILNLCLDGLTTREIGKKIGVSHVRVVKLMSVIRSKCRKHID